LSYLYLLLFWRLNLAGLLLVLDLFLALFFIKVEFVAEILDLLGVVKLAIVVPHLVWIASQLHLLLLLLLGVSFGLPFYSGLSQVFLVKVFEVLAVGLSLENCLLVLDVVQVSLDAFDCWFDVSEALFKVVLFALDLELLLSERVSLLSCTL